MSLGGYTECMNPDGFENMHCNQLDKSTEHSFFSARIYHSAVATLGMDHLAIAGSLSPLPFGISPSLGVIPFLSWSRVVQSVLRNSFTASNWASSNATHTHIAFFARGWSEASYLASIQVQLNCWRALAQIYLCNCFFSSCRACFLFTKEVCAKIIIMLLCSCLQGCTEHILQLLELCAMSKGGVLHSATATNDFC